MSKLTRAERRDAVIASCVAAGKITENEAPTWRRGLDRDETRTMTVLNRLASPLAPPGKTGAAAAGGGAQPTSDEVYAGSRRRMGSPLQPDPGEQPAALSAEEQLVAGSRRRMGVAS